eukprot:s120_g13.t1
MARKRQPSLQNSPDARRQRAGSASSPAKLAGMGDGEDGKRRRKARANEGSEPYAGVIQPGINPWSPDPSLSLEEIFTPETTGALRIEKIFDIFGDPRNEYVDVQWFDSNGKPNVEADPCNRPLQQSTVAEYEQRLFHSGLADDCEKQRNYPLLALSFNHRRAAFYQARAKDKGHPMIQQTEAKGLRRCRILSASTPDIYIEWLCNQHNKYHRGSGQTVCGIMSEAIKEWHLAHGDFLDGAPPAHSIGMLNQCVNVVIKSLKSYHSKAEIKNVMIEAMKFCAPCLAVIRDPAPLGGAVPSLASETQRHIPYVFDKPQGNAEDKRAVMANIMTPMSDSVTFQKMLKKQVETAEEKAVEAKLDEGLEIGEAERDAIEEDGEGAEDEDTEEPNVDAALKGLQSKQTKMTVKKITAKKKKTESKAKGKAKNKSKNKAKDDDDDDDGEAGNPSKGLIECVGFSTTIASTSRPPTSREKHALDDFLLSLAFARSNLKRDISDAEYMRTERFLISMFLELAWLGVVSVNGKPLKTYSAFREEAQKVFWAAHQKLHVGTQSYDPLQLATDLLQMVNQPVVEGGEGASQEESDSKSSEEGMLQLIKSFDSEGIKSFIEGQLHLPPSIHERFSILRQALGTRHKQFVDLTDIKLQMKFFYDLFQECKVFPAGWLNYASSVGFFYGQAGRFVEASEAVFRTDANLGRVLSMRAKYTILGLKDLVSMRALSAAGSESQQALVQNLTRFSSQVEMVGEEDNANSDFMSALAAFDAESRLQYRGDTKQLFWNGRLWKSQNQNLNAKSPRFVRLALLCLRIQP